MRTLLQLAYEDISGRDGRCCKEIAYVAKTTHLDGEGVSIDETINQPVKWNRIGEECTLNDQYLHLWGASWSIFKMDLLFAEIAS